MWNTDPKKQKQMISTQEPEEMVETKIFKYEYIGAYMAGN